MSSPSAFTLEMNLHNFVEESELEETRRKRSKLKKRKKVVLPRISSASSSGKGRQLHPYKIIQEIVKYEEYIPFKKLAEYKKGDKLYIDTEEVEDFERVGTDCYFTALS